MLDGDSYKKEYEVAIRKFGFSEEDTFKVANSRRGWYARANGDVVNYILSPKVLSMPNKKEGRPGLVDPYRYYLSKLEV